MKKMNNATSNDVVWLLIAICVLVLEVLDFSFQSLGKLYLNPCISAQFTHWSLGFNIFQIWQESALYFDHFSIKSLRLLI